MASEREGQRIGERWIYASTDASASTAIKGKALCAFCVLLAGGLTSVAVGLVAQSLGIGIGLAVMSCVAAIVVAWRVDGDAVALALDERRKPPRAAFSLGWPQESCGAEEVVHASDVEAGDWVYSYEQHRRDRLDAEDEHEKRQRRWEAEQRHQDEAARERDRHLEDALERLRQQSAIIRRPSTIRRPGLHPDLDPVPDIPIIPPDLSPHTRLGDLGRRHDLMTALGRPVYLPPAKRYRQVIALLRRPGQGMDLEFGFLNAPGQLSSFDRQYYRRKRPVDLKVAEEHADGVLEALMELLCSDGAPQRESDIITSLSPRSPESTRRAINASLTARLTTREQGPGWRREVLARVFQHPGRAPGHEHCHVLPTDQGRIWVKAGHRRATWNVPPKCPHCGASVAQAVKATEPSPRCDFCRNPLNEPPS
jgi:hypothetical protein